MAAKYKTSLSVGADVRSALLNDPDVAAMTQKIFPIVSDEARLPYIVYRRVALEERPTKMRGVGSDVANVEIACLSAGYAESVELAEAARHALETSDRLRGCVMIDSEEAQGDDAYQQIMIFRILT